MNRFSLSIVLIAALAVGSSAVGCATPTLPLPPPAALTAGPPDADGIVTIRGESLAEAYVFCLNLDLDAGVIVRADTDGNFTCQPRAEVGNYVSVWQELGSDSGPPLEIRIPAP